MLLKYVIVSFKKHKLRCFRYFTFLLLDGTGLNIQNRKSSPMMSENTAWRTNEEMKITDYKILKLGQQKNEPLERRKISRFSSNIHAIHTPDFKDTCTCVQRFLLALSLKFKRNYLKIDKLINLFSLCHVLAGLKKKHIIWINKNLLLSVWNLWAIFTI